MFGNRCGELTRHLLRADDLPVEDEPSTRAVADLLAEAADLERLAQAVQVRQHRLLVAIEQTQRAEDRAAGTPGKLCGLATEFEVAEALGVSRGTAQRRLATAQTLTSDLPQLLRLAGTGTGAGQVSAFAVKMVADEMDVLDPDLRRLVDAELAVEIQKKGLLPGELARAARRRVLAVDADTAAKRAAKARASRRGVRLGDARDGIAGIYATLRAEEAVAVFKKLDGDARNARSAGDPRALNDLMADHYVYALLGRPTRPAQPAQDCATQNRAGQPEAAAAPGEEVEHPTPAPTWRADRNGNEPWFHGDPPNEQQPDPAPDHPAWDRYATDPNDAAEDHRAQPAQPAGSAPVRPRVADRVELQVVLTGQMLLGADEGPALLRGYGALPMPAVRDLVSAHEAAGGTTAVRRLFADPTDGRLLTMEKQTRRFTGLLAKLGTWREQGRCRLTAGRLSDLDHRDPKIVGGPTSARNCQGLGRRSHTFKDHPGVHIEIRDIDRQHKPGDGLVEWWQHCPDLHWTLPSGQTSLRSPPAALDHGSTPTTVTDHERLTG